jgi:glycosyltransferase involved in cell wall biosynthesis
MRPLVVTAHGDDVLVAPRRWHMRGIVRNVIRRADLVTVPGNHMKTAITALAGDSVPPVSVFQYGVESDRLIELAHERRRDSTEARTALRVISTRPLIPDSRIDLLLEALAILRARGVACDCEVLGGGPEQRRLERDVESLGLEGRVRLRGHVSPDEVEHTIARSDVCVSVARSDGTSMSLLEGMALGSIPVVADLPANREWVSDGTNGVVTAPMASDLADAIERSATLDRRRAVEENQRLVHDRADRAVNLAASERLLQELVERKRLASVDR